MSETHALALIPQNLMECVDLSERLSKATLLPKAFVGKPADVMLVMMTGQEMGLAPMAALRGFFVIDGKVGMYADTMVAVALSRGAAKYFRRIEESDTSVTYETMRIGEDKPRRCTWTAEMAKRAGLNSKDNHRLYPRQLLASRCKAELARDVYPDVLAGMYTPDELGSVTPIGGGYSPAPVERHADVADAEIVPAVEPEEFSIISAADSIDVLKALIPKINALPDASKIKAKTLYAERLKALRDKEPEKVSA